MAVDVPAMRTRQVGESFHADDAGALADLERAGVIGGGLLGGDGLGLLGLEELFFRGGGFVCEVEFFDGGELVVGCRGGRGAAAAFAGAADLGVWFGLSCCAFEAARLACAGARRGRSLRW